MLPETDLSQNPKIRPELRVAEGTEEEGQQWERRVVGQGVRCDHFSCLFWEDLRKGPQTCTYNVKSFSKVALEFPLQSYNVVGMDLVFVPNRSVTFGRGPVSQSRYKEYRSHSGLSVLVFLLSPWPREHPSAIPVSREPQSDSDWETTFHVLRSSPKVYFYSERRT